MAAWKLDRRRSERFKVAWAGRLTCYFPGLVEDIEVKVMEISAGGARLEVETLEIGINHLVVGSESTRFTLKLSLPEYALSVPIRMIWYSAAQDKHAFNLGVLFLDTSAEVKETFDKILKDVALATAGS
jgi:hypothetical protein